MLHGSAKIRHSDEDEVKQKSELFAYQAISLAYTTTEDDTVSLQFKTLFLDVRAV